MPFVIHIFRPVMEYSSPWRAARVVMPSTSVPTCGSDMHMPPTHSPETTFGRMRARCSSFALR